MKDLSHIKCFVFDLDGTIYLGDTLFEGVQELFQSLDEKQIQYYFLTNNSSKSGNSYVDKLHAFGLTQIERKQIITSADITIDYLLNHNAKKVCLIGTPDLEGQFIRAGLQLVKEKDDNPDFVVVGFDTTFNYKKSELAVHFAREGTPLVSTNEDILCPMPDFEYIPDCAAITAMIETASGVKSTYFGKPQKTSVEFIEKTSGFTASQMAMVGDRLYTDMQMSQHGMETILVLSGETKVSDIDSLQSTIFSIQDVNKLKTMI